MLKLKNITKIYITGNEKLKALDGIDITFRKSEFVSILGPSGCGKTTLAMALAHDLNMPCRTFNASTGNKKEMDLIIE